MMQRHELKSWPEYYEPISSGKQPFTLRLNDRKFAVGDQIEFREWDDRKGSYTGRSCKATITAMLEGAGPGCIPPLRGLSVRYAILGLRLLAG